MIVGLLRKGLNSSKNKKLKGGKVHGNVFYMYRRE